MPDFRRRLTRAQQRHYDRSNRFSAIPLRVSTRLRSVTIDLKDALASGDRRRTQALSQAICDEVCAALRVRSPRVWVKGVRKPIRGGELHGLFSTGSSRGDQIEVWMFTLKRRQPVAFKTFLRTLLHEICHHLDYALLRLGESFHTDGFFKRESSLVRQITDDLPIIGEEGRSARTQPAATAALALTGVVSQGFSRYPARRKRDDVREGTRTLSGGEKFLDSEPDLVASIADLLSRGGTKLLLKKVRG